MEAKVKKNEKYVCKFFGKPKMLSNKILPNYSDIILYYNYYRKNNKQPIKLPQLAKTVLNIWNEVGIPTIDKSNCVKVLQKYFEEYKQLIRSYSSKKKGKNFETKLEQFKENGISLFDVAYCRCDKICSCSVQKQIPKELTTFLNDQRNGRKLKIPRKLKEFTPIINDYDDCNESNSDEYDDGDTEYEAPNERKKKTKNDTTTQNRMDITPILEQSDRYGLSLRATAALATATLTVAGIVDNNNTKLIIDKNKVNRQLSVKRKSLRIEQTANLRYNLLFIYPTSKFLILKIFHL